MTIQQKMQEEIDSERIINIKNEVVNVQSKVLDIQEDVGKKLITAKAMMDTIDIFSRYQDNVTQIKFDFTRDIIQRHRRDLLSLETRLKLIVDSCSDIIFAEMSDD